MIGKLVAIAIVSIATVFVGSTAQAGGKNSGGDGLELCSPFSVAATGIAVSPAQAEGKEVLDCDVCRRCPRCCYEHRYGFGIVKIDKKDGKKASHGKSGDAKKDEKSKNEKGAFEKKTGGAGGSNKDSASDGGSSDVSENDGDSSDDSFSKSPVKGKGSSARDQHTVGVGQQHHESEKKREFSKLVPKDTRKSEIVDLWDDGKDVKKEESNKNEGLRKKLDNHQSYELLPKKLPDNQSYDLLPRNLEDNSFRECFS